MPETNPKRDTRWLALFVLFCGTLMIVLDGTIVNVALPSIRDDLGFTESGLAWIVNGYLLTFGGFLLLGGRLGDLFGHRRLFLTGIALFTLASVLCGVSESQTALIAARALQGVGGALSSATGLSLVMTMFTEPKERAKAMGYFGFVAAGGGAIGVLAGGLLTGSLNWHWIFLVNLPIGLAVFFAGLALLPRSRTEDAPKRLDVAGALAITASLLIAVYAVVNGNEAGWLSMETLGFLGVALLLMIGFLVLESKVASPLVPLGLFRNRNLSVSNAIGVLWAAAMFAWFFLCALYLQVVLGFGPMQVGLSFLPGNVIMGLFSLGLSAWIVNRFGVKKPLAAGLALAALAFLWLARVPVDGTYLADVLPSMVLLGLGAGTAFNPIFLAAMSGTKPSDAGLASGVVNTSFMMGGALGLAVLASIAAAATGAALSAGVPQLEALTEGYRLAFFVAAACAATAAALGAFALGKVSLEAEHAPAAH